MSQVLRQVHPQRVDALVVLGLEGDLATGEQSAVIVGLDFSDRVPEGFFPFGMMSGVDVTDRWIYVSDDGVNQVYKFHKRR